MGVGSKWHLMPDDTGHMLVYFYVFKYFVGPNQLKYERK